MTTALLNRIDDIERQIDKALPLWSPQQQAVLRQPALSFEVVDTFAGFEALEGEWTDLLVRSAQPWQVFLSFNWNWHWCRHYLAAPGRRGTRLGIVTGRLNGRLELILPLAVSRVAGLTKLSWMGEPVSQYGDAIASPVASDTSTLDEAFSFATKALRADLANMRKVRDDAAIAPFLAARGAEVTAREEAPYMDLASAPDFDTYESRRPPKRRKNRRRHMRRLEERGSVNFAKCSEGDEAAHLADYAVRMKRAQLHGKGGIAPTLADPRFAAFFADAAHGRGRPVGCKVMSLRSNGEIAAMQIVLDQDGRRFLHVAVFTGKFDKCGVGGLLLEQAMIDCFQSGIGTFDMLAPKHDYKMDFADGTVVVADHALGLSAAGRAYVRGVLGMRAGLKAAIGRLPAPARRAIGSAIALVRRNG